MRAAAVIFVLTPWIVAAFFRAVGAIDPGAPDAHTVAIAWLAVSPAVTALGLLIANTEGYREGRSEINQEE